MASQLQKNKEKKYYSKLNETIVISLKKKIDDGCKLDDNDISYIKGPDSDKIISYLKRYYELHLEKKRKGFEI
jgi:hypothetical protein